MTKTLVAMLDDRNNKALLSVVIQHGSTDVNGKLSICYAKVSCFYPRNRKHGLCHNYCYRNISGSLVEQETLMEHELAGKYFSSFFEFSQTSTSVFITR